MLCSLAARCAISQTPISLTLLLALAAPAVAQSPVPLLTDPRIPLHTLPDDPVGGTYGLWAAGSGYKASFHDGFAFYPYRGADGAAVRFHWRTESIRRGSDELLTATPEPHTTQWRHERRHPRVREVYDIRAEGVEQSFVFEQRPTGSGDVVVVGRITTDLQAPVASDAVQELTFTEDEQPIVRYGRALAFDAAGHSIDVTTACDGARITLRLPEAFVVDAEYPLTIDPLTSPVSFAFSLPGAPIVRTAIAVDNSDQSGNTMVVFSRQASATDTDAWGYMFDKDFSNPVYSFSDLSANWDTSEVDTCFVNNANRYVIAFQRDFSATSSGVRVYTHHTTNTTLNSGPVTALFPPLGFRHRLPQLGGVSGIISSVALLVCEQDPIGPASAFGTRLTGVHVNALAGTLGTPFDIGNIQPADDGRGPTVMSTTVDWAFYNPWVVTYVEYRAPTQKHLIRIAVVDNNGPTILHTLHDTPDALDSVKIDGSWSSVSGDGTFLVSWIRRLTGFVSGKVEALQFDLEAGNPPVTQPIRTVVSSSPILGDLDLAHDWQTRSHWAVTYSQQTSPTASSVSVARLGGSGGVVESQSMHSTNHPGELAVGYSWTVGTQRFMVCYALEDTFQTLVGREFLYDSAAGTTLSGSGCNNGHIVAIGEPFAGNHRFGFRVPIPGSFDLVAIVLGFQTVNVSLPPWPSCPLLVNPDVIALVSVSGFMPVTYALPLPDSPAWFGDFYVQGAVLTSFSISPRLEVRVR